ncbi:SAM-dependent methyltransferase [Streptantibioticus silvisoli]
MADESMAWAMRPPRPPKELSDKKAHSARMYDVYLGGKTNYPADRQAAEQVKTVWPTVQIAARANRSFMHRATGVLARDHGIRQWLDIGTGIPTEPNLHQVAQSILPQAHVVYADHDEIVLAYARALMDSTPEGRTAYVQGDLRHPQDILTAPDLLDTLDLDQPVALSLNAVLHFMTDDDRPYDIVATLLDALPSGSAIALSHCTPEFEPETWAGIADIYNNGGTPVQFRTKPEFERFFDGLDLLEPGITVCHRWRPDGGPESELTDGAVSLWGGVALKP